MRQKLALVVVGPSSVALSLMKGFSPVRMRRFASIVLIAHLPLNGTARDHACGADATTTGACKTFAIQARLKRPGCWAETPAGLRWRGDMRPGTHSDMR